MLTDTCIHEKEVDADFAMATRHIFIVDDEEFTRFTLALILRRSGYRVSTAKDGSTALQSIRTLASSNDPVDLIVTDIRMAGLSGIQLIDALGRDHIQVPVIVITGYGTPDNMRALSKMGVMNCLEKPFHPCELLGRIDKVLGEHPYASDLKTAGNNVESQTKSKHEN